MDRKRESEASSVLANEPTGSGQGRANTHGLESTAYEPRTPLGKRLMELRRRIVESGEPLLDWNALERELAERRGEAGVEKDRKDYPHPD